jgi:hypothetical protein
MPSDRRVVRRQGKARANRPPITPKEAELVEEVRQLRAVLSLYRLLVDRLTRWMDGCTAWKIPQN